MTIRRGEDWGERGPKPVDLRLARDNHALFEHVNSPSRSIPIGLGAGDLARTVAADPDPTHLHDAVSVMVLPIDLIELEHDQGSCVAAAHVVARRAFWRGPALLIANAQFLGKWDIAPRSHPNDGFLDVLEVSASMRLGQRLGAARRLPTASHLPHPDLSTRRIREGDWTFERPLQLWADGTRIGPTSHLRVRCLPDALTVCI